MFCYLKGSFGMENQKREDMIRKINELLKTADLEKIDLILRFSTHLLK